MYQEDAERTEHERELARQEDERRRHGTGQVDLRRDDWLPDAPKRELLRDTVTPDGSPVRLYSHPHIGYVVYVGGWYVGKRATRSSADDMVERYEKGD